MIGWERAPATMILPLPRSEPRAEELSPRGMEWRETVKETDESDHVGRDAREKKNEMEESDERGGGGRGEAEIAWHNVVGR